MKRILFTLLLISIAFVGLSFISAADVEQISPQPIQNDFPVTHDVKDLVPIVEKVSDERPWVQEVDDADNTEHILAGSGLGGGEENQFYATLDSGIGGGDNPHIIATLGSGIGGGDNPHII